MANEITVSAALLYSDLTGTRQSMQVTDLGVDPAGQRVVRLKQNVGTTPEAIVLGDLTSLGYAIFVNRDPTNYIELLTGVGGVAFAKLPPRDATKPGDQSHVALFHFGSGVTAPYARANTAACDLDVFIIEA